MKKPSEKKKRVIGIFLLLIVTVGALSACGHTASEESSAPASPVDWMISYFKNVTTQEEFEDKIFEGESLFHNAGAWFFYREQLNEDEKEIYDAFQTITLDPTSTEYRKTIRVSDDPTSEEFAREVARAYQALMFDHSELFWFRSKAGLFSYYHDILPDENGEWRVAYELSEPYADYVEEMTAFNAAVDAFLAEIDLTREAPYVAMDIHDKLIDMVTYDGELAKNMYRDEELDHGFTAYGALVENSRGEAHTCVCDGYSYAYTYLLQQAGIPVMRISGKVGADMESLGPHSWNLVQLDGEWYEVDPTWDDHENKYDPEDPDDALFIEAMNDPYYWGKICHVMFLRTTEEMNYFVPDDSYTYYSENGYATFLSPSYHIRDTEEEADVPNSEDYLSYLAPVATGSAYSFEKLVYGVAE